MVTQRRSLRSHRPRGTWDQTGFRPVSLCRKRHSPTLRLRSGQALSRSVRKGGRHGRRFSTRRTGRTGLRSPPLPRTQGWATQCGDFRRTKKGGPPGDGSFIPQCEKWVHLGGPSGRQIARQQRDHSQHKRYCNEGFGIVGADAEQQAAYKVH